ncbi:MAG: hypothetical protein E7E92_08190 [Clostridiales bacterium]|nr:hypothetical protein [Clostridiales bacterium]
MEINVNINANKDLTDAIVKFSDALELLAKKGIGNVLYKNDLVEQIAREVKNEIPVNPIGTVQKDEELVQAKTVEQQATQQKDTQPTSPVTNKVPTTEVSYDINQIAVAATGLVDTGRQQDLLNLLAKFGVQALTQLDKSQFGAFATELRGLGANI